MKSHDSKMTDDSWAWKVDRAQAIVGPGLATPLFFASSSDSFQSFLDSFFFLLLLLLLFFLFT